jgi:phosphate transport system substrate-binding protein
MKVVFKLLFVFTLYLVVACNSGNKSARSSETPTSGSIKISVDESFKSIIDSQVFTFQALYKKAKVSATYTNEVQAFKDILNDSARVIIVARVPNKSELDFIKSKGTKLRVTKLVFDGVALIVHPSNLDTLISEEQLADVLTGKIKSWSDLGFSKNKEKITVVFDHEQGANARFLRDSIIQGKKFSSNCFALKSNEEVINYISEHKYAIGVVSVNWVSDRDDPTVEQFLTKVKLMNVGPGDYYDYSKYVKPYQAYIATKQYPLCRCVYAILREPRNGLGTGFVSFVAGEKGQRMFLKAGLVPVNMPIRLVEVTSDNLE